MIIISNGGVFYCAVCLVAHSFPNLGDPTDCGPPGSSGHGILQAGVLEWGAIASSGSQDRRVQFQLLFAMCP